MSKKDTVLTELESDEIVSVKYLIHSGRVAKTVIQTMYPVFGARLELDGKTYRDSFNDKEPYDRMTHVFYVCRRKLAAAPSFRFLCCESSDDKSEVSFADIENKLVYENSDELIQEYDSKIELSESEAFEIADGVIYKRYDCADKNGAPVKLFVLFADSSIISFAAGTPFDGDEAVFCRQTVEDEANAALANGKNIIAATNADFFDMFGDSSPSGLCVKDGKVIANGNCMRAFFGVTDDGTPVITDFHESPEIKSRLVQAVSGLQRVLKGGKLHDVALLEPFGYVRHPRTAVGIRDDGTVILLVADGRIPDYSNGASLVDIALIMQKLGAKEALNLDGGGSSIMIIRHDGAFETKNNPADLFKPTERLIREGYNSILVTG